LFLFLKTSSM